ncbi:hypothetical protein D3C73_911080 [compost metagenome]
MRVVRDHIPLFELLTYLHPGDHFVWERFTSHRTETTTQLHTALCTVFVLDSNSRVANSHNNTITFCCVSKEVVNPVRDHVTITGLYRLNFVALCEHRGVILNTDEVNPFRVITVSTRRHQRSG